MTSSDFSPGINNPKGPKVLILGNNPDSQNIHLEALGLYNSCVVKFANKRQLKSSVIIDVLPTIYFREPDNLIVIL